MSCRDAPNVPRAFSSRVLLKRFNTDRSGESGGIVRIDTHSAAVGATAAPLDGMQPYFDVVPTPGAVGRPRIR